MRSTATLSRVVSVTALSTAAITAQPRTPSPALLVLNKQEATLAIIDPASNQVIGRVPTGEGPHEVAVSTDGGTAFVSNYGSQTPGSTLSVIDLTTMKEMRRVELAPLIRPHGLAFAAGRLYVTAEGNRLLARYDPAANRIDWLMGTGQTGTHMVSVNRDASRIITANIGNDTMTVMERGANSQTWNVTVIPVGRGPEGFDVSPDDRELWAAHSRDGGISVIDLATRKVVHTIDAQTTRSNRLKFTLDGKLALISDLDSGELVVVDAAARKPLKRIKVGTSPEGILIPPDRRRAYVAVTGDNQIAIVDLETLEITARIAPGAGPDGMAWSERKPEP